MDPWHMADEQAAKPTLDEWEKYFLLLQNNLRIAEAKIREALERAPIEVLERLAEPKH